MLYSTLPSYYFTLHSLDLRKIGELKFTITRNVTFCAAAYKFETSGRDVYHITENYKEIMKLLKDTHHIYF